MKPGYKNIFFSKYTLLALSVTFFTFSFFFNKIYSNRSSVTREVRLAEKYLNHHQDDFTAFIKDTSLINRLLGSKETLNEFSRLTSRPYGIFLYSINVFNEVKMKFWKTNPFSLF